MNCVNCGIEIQGKSKYCLDCKVDMMAKQRRGKRFLKKLALKEKQLSEVEQKLLDYQTIIEA